jgi:two-component system, chemotaxis family, protein-glutamate methylesterase/glutaminase
VAEETAGAISAPRTRVLIVDDSAVMRSLLRSVVCGDAALEVAGTAADGRTALNALAQLRPDLILLDVEMPVMDGLETLRQIRERAPRLPIIMCSALTQRGAQVTIEALASGASDYVAKPAGQESREAATRTLAQELIPKIRALTSRHSTSLFARRTSLFPARPMPRPTRRVLPDAAPAVVAIGVSTGGPAALDILLPALPVSFPLPVLIVQHMPEIFTRQLAERLDTRCALRVREAEEGMAVRAGEIYIARGNWHMRVAQAPARSAPPTLHLDQAPQENHCRPAVDCLFRSVAQVYGGSVLAVILTGMGHDGVAGCRTLHELGATILAQDEATSAVWGMPGSVVQEGLAHHILPLCTIASEIVRLTAKAHTSAALLREWAG